MVHKKMFYGVLAVCVLAALIVGSGYIGHLGYMEPRQVNGMDISYDVVCT